MRSSSSTRDRGTAADREGRGTAAAARLRNTRYVVRESLEHIAGAAGDGLMHVTLDARGNKRVVLPDGRSAVEFINCSYLGLDVHPAVVSGAKAVLDDWGVHLCCARSRFSIGPLAELESGLGGLFGGRAITFPSVTSAHMSVMPLLASGELLDEPLRLERGVRFIFDRFAHASMQFMRPTLAEEAEVTTIGHNDLEGLRREARQAVARGRTPVFVGDGVYSMGGLAPVAELFDLSKELGVCLYLDDAHGTSIFGARGEGWVLSGVDGFPPPNLIVTFSLAKGFGTNGGGVIVATPRQEQLVRCFGQTYAFSGPLDFAIVGAALAVLGLHRDGTVRRRQERLRAKVALFDAELGLPALPFSPLRRVVVGSPERAREVGRALVDRGYFVTVALFPVVPRNSAQLRLAITVDHADDDLRGLAAALREMVGGGEVISSARA